MFSKKKSPETDKPKASQDLKISLDGVEMESVNEQLREIEAKKARDKAKS